VYGSDKRTYGEKQSGCKHNQKPEIELITLSTTRPIKLEASSIDTKEKPSDIHHLQSPKIKPKRLTL